MESTQTADAILKKTIKDLLSTIRHHTDEPYVIHTKCLVESNYAPQMQLLLNRQSGEKAVSPELSPAAMAAYLTGFDDGLRAGYVAAKRGR